MEKVMIKLNYPLEISLVTKAYLQLGEVYRLEWYSTFGGSYADFAKLQEANLVGQIWDRIFINFSFMDGIFINDIFVPCYMPYISDDLLFIALTDLNDGFPTVQLNITQCTKKGLPSRVNE